MDWKCNHCGTTDPAQRSPSKSYVYTCRTCIRKQQNICSARWRAKGGLKAWRAQNDRDYQQQREYMVKRRAEDAEYIEKERLRCKLARQKRMAGLPKPRRLVIRDLFDSQSGICANPYCRADLSVTQFNLDHILPISKGGGNEMANLQLLCPPCDRRKYNKTSDEWMPLPSVTGPSVTMEPK